MPFAMQLAPQQDFDPRRAPLELADARLQLLLGTRRQLERHNAVKLAVHLERIRDAGDALAARDDRLALA
jgi:hypothetical protein